MPDITYNQFPISGKIVDFDTLQSDVANLNANAVLESRTINGYDLSANRTIYAQDVPSKNLLPNGTWQTKTVNDVTFTVNADGSITTSGTASANAAFYLYEGTDTNKWNGMILSGCPSGGNASTYHLAMSRTSSPYTTYADDTGDGATIGTVPSSTNVNIYIMIASGTNANGKTFYPMIRPSTAPAGYVPYAKTNVELTKLKTQTTQLLSEFSLPTSFTTKSVSWQDYDLLIVCSTYYQSLTTSTVVPVDYFKGTSSSSMVYLTDATSTGTVYNLYQNGNNSIYVKTTSSSASRGLMIYGIKFAM